MTHRRRHPVYSRRCGRSGKKNRWLDFCSPGLTCDRHEMHSWILVQLQFRVICFTDGLFCQLRIDQDKGPCNLARVPLQIESCCFDLSFFLSHQDSCVHNLARVPVQIETFFFRIEFVLHHVHTRKNDLVQWSLSCVAGAVIDMARQLSMECFRK